MKSASRRATGSPAPADWERRWDVSLLNLRLGRMKDAGQAHFPHVSLAKYSNVHIALEIARAARSLLGASGITLEYCPMRHAANLESVLTYEGTHEIHTLIVGREITGLDAFH